MPSSTTPTPSVDPAQTSEPGPARYAPTDLLVEVVRLLERHGVTTPVMGLYRAPAIAAVAHLLRQLDVDVDATAVAVVEPSNPVIEAAGVLLRAAGVEPSTVTVWP